jgi:hypothetical protein
MGARRGPYFFVTIPVFLLKTVLGPRKERLHPFPTLTKANVPFQGAVAQPAGPNRAPMITPSP